MRKHIQYHEVQHFRQAWLWYLLISSSFIGLLPLIIFIATGEIPFREGWWVLGIVLGITFINLAAFYYARLEIKMSEEGIAYRWWPFFRKFRTLQWEQIDYITVRKYSALKVGYHYNKEFGKVHLVNSGSGYQVVLYNGKKYFFGTQRKLSVENVLQQTGKLKL
ncbi:MAG TPA: hypothetical protein VD993_08515 [Chitinophagaceae bacterium]|nr:hypothetical protein [Chitinophagaceae bacterium]